ncbi:MAG: glycosyltransferase family 4 protein [Deltaproteobacteria bacterium]|nr:MAG: glycosyltransferase family 4 protein [Deltaproteobacteria bacterium]
MKRALIPSTESPGQRLKIAVLIRRFVTTGGAERYAVEVARRLAVKHDVHVFAQEWELDGNENIVFHEIPKFFTKPRFLNQLIFSYFTRRAVDESFDIVHTHERVTSFDVLTVHCHCFRSILTERGGFWGQMWTWLSVSISPRKMAYLWLEKRQFSHHQERMLVAVSENIKRDVQTYYPLPDEYFGIAYPGVDLVRIENTEDENRRKILRTELGLGEDDVVILFVGTEFKRKGLDALLQGFARLDRSDMKLIIAGGGEQKDYIKMASGLNIEQDVIFLGLVKEMTEIYVISDIYVLPTLCDPAGMAPLEAMSLGVPTIMSSSEFAGISEHITDEALILADPRNASEIADAISKLMNEELRMELSEKGCKFVKNFTWQRTTEDTLSIYFKVLELKKLN